jgi:hypothetical protein
MKLFLSKASSLIGDWQSGGSRLTVPNFDLGQEFD